MPTSADRAGRDPGRRTLAVAGALGLILLVGALWASAGPGRSEQKTGRAPIQQGWSTGGGPQVLGGKLRAGVPSVQRFRHDKVPFTLSVGPARPGRNLVRVDTGAGSHSSHGDRLPVYVGLDEGSLTRAVARPGTDGLWAEVDLPKGEATLLVTHGPVHRVPFRVVTGSTAKVSAGWAHDGAECLSWAVGELVAGARPDPGACPSDRLSTADAKALDKMVGFLAQRGVGQVALQADGSARSRAAAREVRRTARAEGLHVVDPEKAPAKRSALVVVAGWESAGRALAANTRLPLTEQRVPSDGTWLAPWLLSPGVVDSTAISLLAADFDIRSGSAQRFTAVLGAYLPDQAPTAASFRAWRDANRFDTQPTRLYAASRAAYLPNQPGHAEHGTRISWFPGGTITPVASF